MSLQPGTIELGVAADPTGRRQRTNRTDTLGDRRTRLRRSPEHISCCRPIDVDHEIETIEQWSRHATGIP